MVKYGKTWWGDNWLDALKGIDFTNRIPRGKSYANTEKVYDVKINGNIVLAKVKGNYAHHYNVQVSFKEFTTSEKKKIAEIINKSPSILSALLNHKLPEGLYYALSDENIELFPNSWEDIDADCNCPDYAPICKHIAGLIYMISLEIDKDPFNIFKFHNCDLYDLLDHFDEDKEDKDIFKIRNIKEILLNDSPSKKQNRLLKEKEEINSSKDNTVNETNLTLSRNEEMNNIDFFNIPELLETTFSLLESNPVFYENDFKHVLTKLYKSISKYSKKDSKFINDLNNPKNNRHGYNPYIILKSEVSNNIGDFNKKKYESPEEYLEKYFLNKWNEPQLWEKFTININSSYEVSKISINKKNKEDKIENIFDIEKKYSLEKLLHGFLKELSFTKPDNYNYNIQFLHLLRIFSMELIKKQAIIPEFFGVSYKKFHIRWIPAIYDKNIQEICEKLYALCPDDLIRFSNKKLSKENQVIVAISIIIAGFLENYKHYGMSKELNKQLLYPVFSIFLNENKKFDNFRSNGFEFLLNQWLSNLSLKSRDYDLFLAIEEENNEKFSIKLKASFDNNAPENIIDIFSSKKINSKLQLLSDVYLINQYLPELNNLVDLKEKSIIFNLNEFSNFFIHILPLLEIMGISIILPKELQKIFKPKLNLTISEKPKNEKAYLSLKELVQFNWKVAIGSTYYSKEEFEELVKKSEGLVKLNNEYVILDKKEVNSLLKTWDKVPKKLNENDLLKAILSGELDDNDVYIDDELNSMINNLKEYKPAPIPNSLNGTLRPYQETGYSWLVQNIQSGFGSILADDMGLGKTIQILTTLLYLKENDYLNKEKILIIVPTSLLFNWEREINKFAPTLKPFIYHGTKRKLPKDDFDIILTSYGVIRKDEEKFKKRKWFLVIVDEAQNIKNPLAQQTKSIKAIKSKSKIALTGTPVENRLSEYWSIFDFINKNYLGNIKKFRKNFIIPIENEKNNNTLKNFKQITNPFILRRLKTDKNIINDLPDKITNDLCCNLSKKQAALYQETVNSALTQIDNEEGINRKGLIFKLINSLKQICNHPAQYTKQKTALISDSGKMELLINILETINETKEKVLIFTQYVQMGNIMQKLIEEKFNTEVSFLNGSLSRKKRDNMVNEFQTNSQKRILIISLKAGGTGLNLTAAQNVIHYDLWWNPAVENQATDRAFRIGQKNNVMVYRFITAGTFEEKINKMIQEKQELAELTLSNNKKFITEMTNNELKEILSLRE